MRSAVLITVLLLISSILIFDSSKILAFAASEIVINELLYDPEGVDTGNEWIELYNSGTSPLDLENYELNATSGDYYRFPPFSLDTGFFIVVHWRKGGSDTSTDLYTGTEGFTSNMGNTKGWVALFNGHTHSKNTIVDYLEYGSGNQIWEKAASDAGIWTQGDFVPDVAEGHSLERSPIGNDTNHPGDFVDRVVPTPGGHSPPPPPIYPKEIYLNEILPNPEGSDDNEFLELYNEEDGNVDLKGWKISDKTSSKIIGEDIVLSSTVIPAEGYLVIYKREGSVSLNNAGDIITLSNPNGEKVDEREYPPLSEGYAYARDDSGNWKETSLPTPGEENQFPESEDDSEENSPIEGEIQAIKKLALGTRIFVQAWVTAEPEILGERVMYIQDKTDGIKVSLDSNNYSKIKLGDYIELACTLEQSRGEYYIKMADPSTLSVLATNQITPKPVRISTGEVGETSEGFLVELFGTVVETSRDTFWIDDSSGKAKIYIKDSTGIEKPETPKGFQAEITGIVSQYGNYKDGTPNFRVLPRYEEDIKVLSETNKENPAGAILGLSTLLPKELPRTGGGNYTLGMAALLLGITLTSATQTTLNGKLHKYKKGIDKK